jgi:LPXTG-site transpeptidase (sortase) family protein
MIMMKKLSPAQLAISGVVLTVIGLIGIVPVLFNSDDVAVAASQPGSSQVAAPITEVKKQEPQAPQAVSGHPVRIVAPTVGVDMPVVDGFYDAKSNDWTLYDDKAQFAAMTTEPNDKSGQTFIYGHATQRVFGKLLNMKVGETVEVYTSNGYKFTYTLKETETVTPQNTGILGYTGSPRLLLQTCVGVWSENRKFFILDFTKVEKV